MPARFWFDNKNHKDKKKIAKGDPVAVVRGLNGDIDEFAKDRLLKFYAGQKQPQAIEILPGYACYMSGTTIDLSAALEHDIKGGLNNFYVKSGLLAVWYIRRAVMEHLETMICIAGRGVEDDSYWSMKDAQLPVDVGRPASQWKEARVTGKLLEDDGRRLPLRGLVDKVLPLGQAEAAWYPEVLKKTWRWKGASDRLRKLCRENTQMDKHLRSDESHSDLYVHDDSMHSLMSPKEKYAEGVSLIKAALNLDYGPDTVDWVFSTIGAGKDRSGLKLKQIQALLDALDKVPDALRFKYLGLRPGSQHNGSIFTQYYAGIFYVLATYDRIEASESSDQSTWQYTGDKVHVSVQRDQVMNAWNLIMPILVGHHVTTQEFKVTDMALTPDNERFLRVMDAFQISIYLHAAPGDEHGAVHRFTKVMRLVTECLKEASIEGTSKLTLKSDLPIDNKYLSFRHDIDDLLGPTKVAKHWTEQKYRGECYIDDRDPRYPKHRELMRDRALYRALRESQ